MTKKGSSWIVRFGLNLQRSRFIEYLKVCGPGSGLSMFIKLVSKCIFKITYKASRVDKITLLLSKFKVQKVTAALGCISPLFWRYICEAPISSWTPAACFAILVLTNVIFKETHVERCASWNVETDKRRTSQPFGCEQSALTIHVGLHGVHSWGKVRDLSSNNRGSCPRICRYSNLGSTTQPLVKKKVLS